MESLDVLLIGGGMISQEVLLPTIFQERARGLIGNVHIATRRGSTIQKIRKLFPDEDFTAWPDPDNTDPDKSCPEVWREALNVLPRSSAVVVATPDHLHAGMICDILESGHHVVVEKPLCLKVAEAHTIAALAKQKAAYCLTDYHKRHDRAIRAAKYKYTTGELGEMLHGHGWCEEKRLMALEVFANWAEDSSCFEYIGCHYVDAYHFITGLKPVRMVAFGQEKFLVKHGKKTWDTIQAVIEWEDDSVLTVYAGWINSNNDTALTQQGLKLKGTLGEYYADHKDRNCFFITESNGYETFNPNFFKTYNDWDDPTRKEYVGYGYDSVRQGLADIHRIVNETAGLPEDAAFRKRSTLIAEFGKGRALPESVLPATAVNEGVRLSLANNSCFVTFAEDLSVSLA